MCAIHSRHRTGTAPPTSFGTPLDFIARLAALVPKPRFNLTRFGVFAPSSKHRSQVTPAQRGRATSPGVHTRRTSCRRDVGTASRAGVQHRHPNLQSMRWHRQGDRLHRRSRGRRENTQPPEFAHTFRTSVVAPQPGNAASRTVRLPRRSVQINQGAASHNTREGTIRAGG